MREIERERSGEEPDHPNEHDVPEEGFLPELPGEADPYLNLVQLELRRGETARALLSYLDWLRGDQLRWRTLQGPPIEEPHAALLSATLQTTMMAQALCLSR